MIIRQILLQAVLTQMLIFAWNYYAFRSLEQAAISTAALVLFTGLYGSAIGILMLGKVKGFTKMIVCSLVTSLLVTITFIFYPQLGLVVEWYMLFVLMFVAGIIAYGLSWEPENRGNYQNEQYG